MPTYNYSCVKCGNTFELYQSVADRDKPLDNLCVCCEGRLRRSIGNSGGFRLGTKGSISWAKGGYSTLLGDVWKSERS